MNKEEMLKSIMSVAKELREALESIKEDDHEEPNTEKDTERKWIPREEDTPNTCKSVLCWRKGMEKFQEPLSCWYCEDDDVFYTINGDGRNIPTVVDYWMPMPKPPEEDD